MKKNRKGFTLAEVLITISIIGIVAAMTLPNLIADIQNRDWNTADSVFIKRLEQSLKVMNTQSVLSGYSSTEEFANELKKHFKIANVCDNENLEKCFNNTFFSSKKNPINTSAFKTSKDFAVEDWGTNVVGVQFGNGVTGLMAYNPKCEENPNSNEVAVLNCIALLYDVNGFTKPNQMTKDLRTTANVGDGFTDPLVINGVKITKVIKLSDLPPVIYDNGTWPDCDTFKAQYGTESCTTFGGNTDYYAGAVATCGGMHNMPTDKELAAIAQYLYNYPSIVETANSVYTGEIDTKKRDELVGYGFPLEDFSIIAQETMSYHPAYMSGRTFSQNETKSVRFSRTTSTPYVICVQH